MARTSDIQWNDDDDVRFVLDQHTEEQQTQICIRYYPAPDNFTLDRAVHPEIPGFYDEYGNHHMKMMELNAKRNVQLRRQLHQEETQVGWFVGFMVFNATWSW
jgi:hypothetical protein